MFTIRFALDSSLSLTHSDNLAANYSRELADYIIYVIDVAGGDKVPRKGGPGITQSDLLIINKTDLAEAVGADLEARKNLSTTRLKSAVQPNFMDLFRRNVELCTRVYSTWSMGGD